MVEYSAAGRRLLEARDARWSALQHRAARLGAAPRGSSEVATPAHRIAGRRAPSTRCVTQCSSRIDSAWQVASLVANGFALKTPVPAWPAT